MTTPSIFIGYRRDDGGHARALYEKLLDWYDAGQVFLDHENLDPGAKFLPELETAIAGCKAFLAVIGPHWLSEKNRERLQDPDDITRGEIRSGLRHGKAVIPVLAGGAGFPRASDLPADIAAMGEPNAHHQLEAQYLASFIKLRDILEKNHSLKPVYRRRDGRCQPFHPIDLPLSLNFVDPAGHLPELHQALADQGAAAVIAAASVHGMGGVGKTQLALKYSHDYRSEYAGVWWFRAENTAQLELDCQEFCAELGCPPREGELPHQAVKRWLQTQPRWLLVYDNAENKHDLAEFLPTAGGHHILITSRDRDWSDVAQPLALDVWTERQALEFLRRRLPDEKLAASANRPPLCKRGAGGDFAEGGNARDDQRRQLAHALGGLPLALEQACAYILKQRVTVADYCREVANWQRENPLLDRRDATGYPYSVLTTLSLAFGKLSQAARELLRLSAWFAPEPVPERLFTEHAGLLPASLQAAAGNNLGWAEAAAQLESHALIQRGNIPALDRQSGEDRNEPAFTLHRLTQEAARAKLADEAADCAATVALLRAAYPRDARHPANWPTCAALLPHVRRLQDFYPHGWVEARALSWLLDRAAVYLQYGPALYGEAMELFKAALEIDRSTLGEDHPDTLTSLNNLAGTLRSQGDLPGARAMHEQALEIKRRVQGEEHPSTLSSLNNLAATLSAQGDLPGARAMQEQALTISRRVLGEEHPSTLSSLNNLAGTLWSQGDLPGARALEEQALEIKRRVLGEEHPSTLTSLNNLAETLRSQGDLPGARAMHEQALTIRRRVQGEEHPDTLTSLNNLALTLSSQGDLPGARALQEQALTIRRRVLGEEHPSTLTSLNNLAETLRSQGDLPGARAMHEQELAICRRVLGEEHPSTLTSLNNLAETLSAQGDLPGARALHEQALEIKRRVLGEEHHSTSISAFNLLMTLRQAEGAGGRATEVYRDCLAWLPQRDPSTLGADQRTIRENLIAMMAPAPLNI